MSNVSFVFQIEMVTLFKKKEEIFFCVNWKIVHNAEIQEFSIKEAKKRKMIIKNSIFGNFQGSEKSAQFR